MKSCIIDFREIDSDRFVVALKDLSNFIPEKNESQWFSLMKIFPENLRFALLAELRSGNKIDLIQNCDWPQKGSIVISLKSKFKNSNWSKFGGVKYREMNDPHYWESDIHVNVDGTEYLIVV